MGNLPSSLNQAEKVDGSAAGGPIEANRNVAALPAIDVHECHDGDLLGTRNKSSQRDGVDDNGPETDSFLRFSSYDSHDFDEPSVIDNDNRSLTSLITMDEEGDDNDCDAAVVAARATSPRTTVTTKKGDRASFYPSSVHGNLLQAHPGHCDPMRYYEVVKVLGEGSMGSVAKVRRRPRPEPRTSARGASGRVRGRNENGRQRDGSDEGGGEKQQYDCCGPILLSLVKWHSALASHKNPFVDSDELSPLHNERSIGSSLRSTSKTSSDSSSPTLRSSVVCCTATGPQPPASASASAGEAHLRHAWPSSSTIITHGSRRDCCFALKSIHLRRCTNQQYMKELKNEVAILKELDHPNIVKAYETFDYRSRLFLVLELCSGGDLYQRDPYTEGQAARITKSLLSAVSYLHEHQIVHRDLKYENIMFSDPECAVDSIKVIDFGLSQKFARNQHLRDAVGTVYTMSPELLTGDYTEKNDVWSVGVIGFMLLSSSMPFYGRDRAHVIRRIITGKFSFASRRWKPISTDAKAFVESLLEMDPEKRPSACDAWNNPWLQNFGDEASSDDNDEVEGKTMDRIQANIQAFAEYSKLKRLALMVIAYQSTDEEIGILKRMFARFDRQQRGDITLEDFKATLSDYYDYSDEELEHMFRGIDIDGTGLVHYTEFLAATVESNGSIDEDQLGDAFDRLDSDGTGYITVSALQSFLGPDIPARYLDAMIDECDVDRDHKISYEEFLALWNMETDLELEQANVSVHSRRLHLSQNSSFDSCRIGSTLSSWSSEDSLFGDSSRHRAVARPAPARAACEAGCGTLAFQKHKRELSTRGPVVA